MSEHDIKILVCSPLQEDVIAECKALYTQQVSRTISSNILVDLETPRQLPGNSSQPSLDIRRQVAMPVNTLGLSKAIRQLLGFQIRGLDPVRGRPRPSGRGRIARE